jgi:hypothetical protein
MPLYSGIGISQGTGSSLPQRRQGSKGNLE